LIFGSIPIDQALGKILAHSYQTSEGRIRKGQILNETQVTALQNEGLTHIIGATLTTDDAHEDTAAMAIAKALAGVNTRLGLAATGRVNIHATADGMLMLHAEDIHRVNVINESITVATLLPDGFVVAGQIIATVKIIPYGIQNSVLSSVLDAIGSGLSVHAIQAKRACLIQTLLPSMNNKVMEKTRRVTENRLLQRRTSLVSEQRPAHSTDAVSRALDQAQTANPDWILIFGASAISGRLGNAIVVGMPGCARSARYNGIDKVLDRLACGVSIDNEWVARLGVGGLLKEMVDRPQPRVVPKAKPLVSALVLAAGSSTRFGADNKLFAKSQGKTLIHHVLQSIAKSHVADITIVTGYQHKKLEQAVRDLSYEKIQNIVYNDAYKTGMASSVVRGFSALIDSDAIVVCLADMPKVSSHVINSLVHAFLQNPDKAIYIPMYKGQRGNPVLVAKRLFDSVLGLEGDTGARALANQFSDSTLEVKTDDHGVRQDVDTTQDLQALDTESGLE